MYGWASEQIFVRQLYSKLNKDTLECGLVKHKRIERQLARNRVTNVTREARRKHFVREQKCFYVSCVVVLRQRWE